MTHIRQRMDQFWKDEEGIGTLEILMILAVLVIIAVAFRKWIMKWVNDLFNKADHEVGDQLNSTDSNPISPSSSPK